MQYQSCFLEALDLQYFGLKKMVSYILSTNALRAAFTACAGFKICFGNLTATRNFLKFSLLVRSWFSAQSTITLYS